VTIIDPVASRVTKDISCPTSRWGDITFIRDQAEIKHLVFANDNVNDKVYVYDALSETVQNRIDLLPGTKPLHLYAVYYYDQVWVHGDGPGKFDVFRTAQVRYRGTAGVQISPTYVLFHKTLFSLIFLFLKSFSRSLTRLDMESLWLGLIWKMRVLVRMLTVQS
jgi:hypothetical protein